MDRANQIIQSKRLQRGSQATNMHVNGTHTHHSPLTPYFFQQSLSRMHFARMSHEEMQQTKLHRAQEYLYVTRPHTVRLT